MIRITVNDFRQQVGSLVITLTRLRVSVCITHRSGENHTCISGRNFEFLLEVIRNPEEKIHSYLFLPEEIIEQIPGKPTVSVLTRPEACAG